MGVKAILFDAGDVLYYRPCSTDDYMLDLLRQRGYPAVLPDEERQIQRSLRGEAFVGRIGHAEYYDRVLLMHGVTDPEDRRKLATQVDSHADEVEPVAGARQALVALKQRGFVLGIVTDTMHPVERKMRWLQRVGMADLVEVMACSTSLGVRKPDPAIYLYAVQQTGHTAVECAFVGHAAHELWGAHQIGLATVAVNYAPGAQADFYATSMEGLPDVPIFQNSHTRKEDHGSRH
jgi:HAD superfamily hydrolase (TIGR01509 family)